MSKTVVVGAVNVVAQAKLTWQSPLDLLESPFDLSRGHTLSNVITLYKMLLLMMLMLELFFKRKIRRPFSFLNFINKRKSV